MAYIVQTNNGTHPQYPEWIEEGRFESREEAQAYIAEQSFVDGVDGRKEPTTFGLDGVRIVSA